MGQAEQQHRDWLARSIGRADYEPLSRSDIESLRRVGEVVPVVPGAHLFKEGDQAEAAFLIDLGEVEIYRGDGRGRRVLAHAGSGSLLGDMAMFGDTSHVACARAVGPVRAYRFERSRLLPELATQPAILLRWLMAGMRRLERTQRGLIGLMHKTVLAQVAEILAEEGTRQPDVNLSQSTIGALLGVSRQSVNESLRRLRDLGVVETGYRRIRILDGDRLADIAQS